MKKMWIGHARLHAVPWRGLYIKFHKKQVSRSPGLLLVPTLSYYIYARQEDPQGDEQVQEPRSMT